MTLNSNSYKNYLIIICDIHICLKEDLGLIFTNVPKTLDNTNLDVNDVLRAMEGEQSGVLDAMAQELTNTTHLDVLFPKLALYAMEQER